MLRDLFKDTLQEILEAEMDEHLGYEKHDNDGDNTGNSAAEKSNQDQDGVSNG